MVTSTLALLLLALPAGQGKFNLGNTDNVSSGSIPSGLIVVVASGSCPSGFSEVTALAGKTLVGTLAANGDVGTTGGSDTTTPAGTVSQPTLAMNSYTPAGTNSTSVVTPLGSVAAPTISWPAGVPTQAADTFGTTKFTTSGSGTAAFTSETARGAISWPAGAPTASSPTFTGSSSTVGAQTFTGTPSTLTGTVSQPTFSGSPADNRSAFVKVIFCSKN